MVAELRYFLTPLEVEQRGVNTYRTLPYWNTRWHTDRVPAVSTSIQAFGNKDFAIANIVAEPAAHDGFVASGAIELPRSGRITVVKLNAIRNMIGLVYVPRFLDGNSDGLTVIRALGVVAQLCQRIKGRFGSRMEDADRTRFDELGGVWAPLKDIADARDRLDAAVALWADRPIYTGGINLGDGLAGISAGGPDYKGGPRWLRPKLTAHAMALPDTEDFTAANGTNVESLDARWTQTSGGGTWVVQSNQIQVPNDSAEVGIAFDDADFIDNHGAILTFAFDGNYNVGPSARHDPTANKYYTHYGEIGTATAIYDVDGTGATELYRSGTCAVNDILGISVVGTTIRAFKNGLQVTSVTDSTWTTGVAGVAGWANTGPRGDNFAAYNCPITVLATTTGTSSGQTHNPGTGVTPKMVIAWMFNSTDSTDRVSSVSYGGVAMTRVATNGFAQDTAGEPCTIYCYVLTSGIPTGSQSVTYSATGTNRLTTVSLDSVWTTLEIKASGKQEGDAANPSITLDSSTDPAVRFLGVMSGGASLTPNGYGIELSDQALSGAFACWVGHTVWAQTGSVAVSATAASDDVAAIAIAIGEGTSGPTEQAVSGDMPASSGTLTRVVTYVRTLTGSMPEQTGALSRIATYLRTITGDMPASSGTLATLKTRFQALAGDMPSATATLATVWTTLRSLTGDMPAPTGTAVKSLFSRIVAGDMPSASGALSHIATYVRSLAGDMPNATGAVTTLKTTFQSLAGDMPSATATIARAIVFARSLAGEMPAPSGTAVKTLFSRALAGDMPSATATIERLGTFARSLAGSMPAATGAVTTMWTTFETLVGNMPAAAGTIVGELLTIAQSLAGALPSPSGALTTLKTHYEALTGDMPAPSAVLSRMYSSFQTLTGNMPSATGTISDAALFAQNLAGTMGAWAGSLATQFSAGSGAIISKYWKKMRRKRAL